jgi:glycerophosphoryl diester phosphodiesterase
METKRAREEEADRMQILSHRGYWTQASERNTEAAFERSFERGFGTETDVRDWDGRLVISHDPPTGQPLLLEAFFEQYRRFDGEAPLALNIKADGLCKRLQSALAEYGIRNYFVFDMSVPDALQYARRGLPFFTRQSEYEVQPSLYEDAAGVWMDCFEREWMDAAQIERHTRAGKRVCLVSPELHGRPHLPFWRSLVAWEMHRADRLMICTDHPEAAKEYFDGNDQGRHL